MKIIIRRFNDHAVVSITVGATTIDLGMMNLEEVNELHTKLTQAADDAWHFITTVTRN